MGVSAIIKVSTLIIQKKQEGSAIQQDSVTGVGSHLGSLTPSSLFYAFLNTTQFEKKFPGDNTSFPVQDNN